MVESLIHPHILAFRHHRHTYYNIVSLPPCVRACLRTCVWRLKLSQVGSSWFKVLSVRLYVVADCRVFLLWPTSVFPVVPIVSSGSGAGLIGSSSGMCSGSEAGPVGPGSSVSPLPLFFWRWSSDSDPECRHVSKCDLCASMER